MPWILRDVNPAEVTSHLSNITIYGEKEDKELTEDIRANGVLQHIMCIEENGKLICLSGHRRKQSARIAGLKSMPALIHDGAMSPSEQLVFLVRSNKQREKTMEQKAREFAALKDAEESLAEERRLANLSKKPSRTGNVAHSTKQGENGTNGRAADLAAEQVGMSRKTAQAAAQVVEAIDEAEAAGDTETAEHLRETLNTKGASPALAESKKKPEPSAVQNGKKTIAKPPFDIDEPRKLISKAIRHIDSITEKSEFANCSQHKQILAGFSEVLKTWESLGKKCELKFTGAK